MSRLTPAEREELLDRALGDELQQRLAELRALILAELPEARADALIRAIEEVFVAVMSRVTSMAAGTIVGALASRTRGRREGS